MDSLTHVVIGAAVGEVTLGKKVGNKALLWGAIAGSIPDLDVLITPFFEPVKALFVHRGFSHSLLFCLIVSSLLAWLIRSINRDEKVSYFEWLRLSLLAILGHLFIDIFNTYGTALLEPFNSKRFSYDTIGIVDLFFTFPLLLSVIVILFYKYINRNRRVIVWIALSYSILYLGFTILTRIRVEKVIKSQMVHQQMEYKSYRLSPAPLTNFLWMVAVEQDDGFLSGYYSIFDNKKVIDLVYTPRKTELLGNLSSNPKIHDLIRFTKEYYVVDTVNGSLWMYDLRYGSLGFNDPKPWVFSFGITQTQNGVEVSRSHPSRKMSLENVKEYWHRVF